jgi:hypothetical protein
MGSSLLGDWATACASGLTEEEAPTAKKSRPAHQSLPPPPSWPSDVVVVRVLESPSFPLLSRLEEVGIVAELDPSDRESSPDGPLSLPPPELL